MDLITGYRSLSSGGTGWMDEQVAGRWDGLQRYDGLLAAHIYCRAPGPVSYKQRDNFNSLLLQFTVQCGTAAEPKPSHCGATVDQEFESM